MSKRVLLSLLVVVGCVAAWVSLAAASADHSAADQQKVASVINDMNHMGMKGLAEMQPVAIRPYELPNAGVDVMRAKLHETYSVDGIGTDTVELSGWIAVRHGQPYLAEGEKELKWGTAVLDTEFVAMDLRGDSKLFGPVTVALDKDRPSYGQVGRIQIPELVTGALMAKLEKNDAAPGKIGSRKQDSAKSPVSKDESSTKTKAPAKPIDQADPDAVMQNCSTPVEVAVSMPNLNLNMKTEHKVFWYSLVDTIPPVGHRASITAEAVRLMSNGRAVAVLQNGVVDFREVVRHVPLSDNSYRVAANH